MEILASVLVAINVLIFFYFIFVNFSYITLIIFSYIQTKRSKKESSIFQLSGLFDTRLYKSISILAPAYNEEASIIESTEALLHLEFADYEIIVVNDGSKDSTLEKLIKHFKLKKIDRYVPKSIETEPIKAIYGSHRYPNLFVVDKENGRKADALNAGINVSRKDLICAVDSDTLLEPTVLQQMLMAFVADPKTVAVGGVVRVANGCKFEMGEVSEVKVPKTFIGRIQAVEYLRAFLFGRTGWDYFDSLLIISGAFGVFDRESVIKVGGYLHDTVGEDMELVVRLHRYYRDRNEKYRVRFLPEPVCWTEVPETWTVLGRQRNRWQRGLADTLWRHKKMLFNPKYGRLGFLAMPFFLFVELLSPIIELGGFIILFISLWLGVINVQFALLFLAAAILLGMILSVLSVLMEELTFRRYDRMRDVAILILYAFFENIGYRQIHAWWRLKGLIDFFKGNKSWGEMTRSGTFSR
ncbi:glycosyltransferase family 2 protein [Rhodohalobacter barkolensis]|uniref:Glycosyl transferase n=1 Tax=Rhodohalobacter barkolensis TaxID=2053187 RepID=A0A2N0VH46_9BACT|nr:glycosyltransferase [Rhodohalobacter barkolensis]PKD43510.1 glycosyl transferase [Rhodohalobacter barkolensis]